MIPLSVFIITKNEEDRIATAIRSVIDLAEEVIVIDSGSTDNTVKIAKELGAKTIYNEWQGYGPQKIFGETKCKHDWILNLDADEEISAKLAEEIKLLFSKKKLADNLAGFYIKMVELPNFAKKAHPFSQYKKYLRLYNKQKASFRDSLVHDAVVVKTGELKTLKHKMLHRSTRSYQHAVEKLNSYSELQAIDAINKGKSINIIQLITIAPISFIKNFIFRRNFLYGINGLIDSYIYAFSRFLKYAKIREMERKKNEHL